MRSHEIRRQLLLGREAIINLDSVLKSEDITLPTKVCIVPEKHLLLSYSLCQRLWLCGSQQTVENSSRDGTTDHLTCLLGNLYAGQEATVRTEHRTTDWFQIGKGVRQGCILSPCLLKNTSWEMLGWMEHKLESRLQGEISITSDILMTPPLWQKVKKKEMKEQSEKAGLKLNIWKTKIMASGPITSWHIDGKTMETVTDFIFLGSKITDCSHEI